MLGKSFLSLVCKHSSNQACYPFLTWKLSIRWACFINQAFFIQFASVPPKLFAHFWIEVQYCQSGIDHIQTCELTMTLEKPVVDIKYAPLSGCCFNKLIFVNKIKKKKSYTNAVHLPHFIQSKTLVLTFRIPKI